jgi:hypothetical protein
MESLKQLGHDPVDGRSKISHLQRTEFSTLSGSASLHAARHLGQCLARIFEEHLTRGGQFCAFRGPPEKQDTELVFEFLDLAGNGRLRNIQPTRCSSEISFFGHSDKIFELPEFHGSAQRVLLTL